MVELILTEKPSAAKRIANSLADTKPIENKIGKVRYYELKHKGKKIFVACAVGHLYALAEKEKNGWTYPIFSVCWKPAYEVNKDASYTKDYINVIKKLAKQADTFYNSCDYDQEGEVIGLNILRYACNQKTAKRMKFSTLTKEELIDSYENASKTIDWPQAEAGETRHFLDFYYGINLSRALTLAVKNAGSFKILSTGRVQGPSLALLAEREEEIAKFKPEPFWEIELTGKLKKDNISAWHEKGKIKDKSKADEILKKTKGKSAIIDSVTKKRFKQSPPLPFDLTSLQIEAYRTLNISPKQTLAMAQILYTSGRISYPRTSSQKLPPAIGYEKILRGLSKQSQFASLVQELLEKKDLKPNEGNKTDPAHPAIYPTGLTFKGEGKTKSLYELIVHRFLATFAPASLRETINLNIDVNKEKFVASGTRTIEKGWHRFYGRFATFKEEILPDVEKGEEVKSPKIISHEKETQPPKRYTPASIIKELEKRNLGTKCLISNTLVKIGSNNKIYKEKISELFDSLHNEFPSQEGSMKIAINDQISCFSFDGVDEIKSNFKLISKRKLNKDEKVYRIGYRGGNHIELTEEHPILIYRKGGNEYIQTKNLKKGMKSLSSIKISDKFGKEIYSWDKFISKCHEKSSLYADFNIKIIRKNIPQYEFAKRIGLSQSRISEYEKRKNIPLYLFKKLKLNTPDYMNSENKTLKIKNPFPLKLGSSLARVLAKSVGDTSIDKEKIRRENCYDFRYHNTNLDLINQFIEDIYSIFGVILKANLGKKRENQLQIYYVRIPAVIGRILSTISEEIVDKNASKLIKKEFYPEFIGALFDDEGHCMKKEKKLFISNTNFQLLGDVKKMLNSLGIESILYKKQFKLYVRRVKSLEKFFIKIPFISLRKKRRLANLVYQEEIISKDFMTKTISSIKKINYKDYVYDITNNLEIPNFILANGIVVHNSTRAQIIDSLYQRNYVQDTSLKVTDLGMKTNKTLKDYCPEIIDEELTRNFEDELEKIRERKKKGEEVLEKSKKVLKKILYHFKENELKIGKSLIKANRETQERDSYIGKCPVCNKGDLNIKKGKFGFFISCDKYEEGCSTTFSIPARSFAKGTDKLCKDCNYPMIRLIRKGARPQEVCINPKCKSKKIDKDLLEQKRKCPNCGAELVIKKSMYGQFFACPNYPKCKHTERIEKFNKNKKEEKK